MKLQITDRNKGKTDRNGKKKKPNYQWRFEVVVNGKKKSFSRSGFRTKAEAEAAGTKALADYNGGSYRKETEITLSEFLNLWFDQYVLINLRNKTQICYSGIIRNHINPALGFYRLTALNPQIVQEFANNLRDKNLSYHHITNIISVLGNALKYGIEKQMIQYNPVSFVRIPRIEKPPKQRIVLSKEQMNTIFSRFPPGNKWNVPIMIGYYTGLRISEAFALTWNDIDLLNGYISVNKQLIRYKLEDGKTARWAFGNTKSKSAVRKIKIGTTLIDCLKNEKSQQENNEKKYGAFYIKYETRKFTDKNSETLYEIIPSKQNNIGLICVEQDGKMISPINFKYCSRIIHEELNIDFDFHSLRHTHATILSENGVNPKSLQLRLGHEKIETTLQTYIHGTEKMEEETAEIFENAVK